MTSENQVKKKAKPRRGQRNKSIEEVLHFSLNHRTKVLALTILNEGVYTSDELSQITNLPIGAVRYHIKELLDAGAIELAETRKVRNAEEHYYRAVEMPYWSDEEIAAMTPQARQVTMGLTIQSVIAETLSAFWAEKMNNDPRVWLTWDHFNVDRQGREEIADEQARHWERITEIEIDSINRCAKTGEEDDSVVVVSLGFERERRAPKPPAKANAV